MARSFPSSMKGFASCVHSLKLGELGKILTEVNLPEFPQTLLKLRIRPAGVGLSP